MIAIFMECIPFLMVLIFISKNYLMKLSGCQDCSCLEVPTEKNKVILGAPAEARSSESTCKAFD